MTTTKFSFKVSTYKKPEVHKEKTNVKFSDAVNEIDESNEKKNVFSIENGVIQGDQIEKKKKIYSISFEKKNDWRIEKLRAKVKDNVATEEEIAKLAIMLELFCDNEVNDTNNMTISNDINNTNADFLNGSEIDADYDAVPVEEYGLAFLRGCGWKKEDGIGKTNKKVVSLRVSEPRPKGLGLGCDIFNKLPTKKNGVTTQNTENVSSIKLGAKVKIISGKYCNLIGILRSIDEDTGSCFIELDENQKIANLNDDGIIRTSIFAIQIFKDQNNLNKAVDVEVKPECSTNFVKTEIFSQKIKEKHSKNSFSPEKHKYDNRNKHNNKIYDRKESSYKKDERYKKSLNYEKEIRHKSHSDKKRFKSEVKNENRRGY